MPAIRLTDGTTLNYDHPITVAKVAADIGAGLSQAAIAADVNGSQVDLSYEISDDATLKIITGKDDAGLDIIRHSTAHLLAQAVMELFPGVEVTIGPVIEDGFYYDFDYERAFTSEDLPAIEKKMKEIAKRRLDVIRTEYSRDQAMDLFAKQGQKYKTEIIADIPATEVLSVYGQGDFVDLCRGPHVPNLRFLKVFKLIKVAGAYWRGDSNNRMLSRIYGTAWSDKKDLQAYLTRLQEAEKRDHRLLAKKMDLFHIQDIAPGEIFWHQNGWILYNIVKGHIRKLQQASGYAEINTPLLVDKDLWVKSGHAAKFSDDMFLLATEQREYALKPMNCPCHVQIFKQGLKSYRDLPLRLAEFGCCHRNEPSGTLHGLMRVRAFVQDDGHIFCTLDQVQTETKAFIKQLFNLYNDFGFTDIEVKLSTRPEKRVGDDKLWTKAETILEDVLQDSEVEYQVLPGEGAFYGPKLEFHLKDCLGRKWQCGTLQLDFFMPGRLQASYIAEDGSKQEPVMLHRAAIGTLERFIGILLEHYAGLLPLWLAPKQLVVIGVSQKQDSYVKEIASELLGEGFRASADLRNEKVGFKIREHTIAKVPYLIVVGDQELATETLTLRFNDGKQQKDLTMDDLLDKIKQEVADRRSQAI